MKRSDRYYLEARAEEEIEKARQSCDPRAVASHYYLAELYLNKLHGSEQEPALLGHSIRSGSNRPSPST